LLGIRSLGDFEQALERFQAEARERFRGEDVRRMLVELSEHIRRIRNS